MYYSAKTGRVAKVANLVPDDQEKQREVPPAFKAGSPVDGFPLEGVNHAAGAFGLGSDLGGGNFVVYDGDGEETTVDGLSGGTTYHFRFFEYERSVATGGHALYRLCDGGQASADPLSVGVAGVASPGLLTVFPNPAGDRLHWRWTGSPAADPGAWEVVGVLGREVRAPIDGPRGTMDISALPPGTYVLRNAVGTVRAVFVKGP